MPRYNGGFIGTDGLDAPDSPTIDSVTAGDQQVSVAFTAPTDTGTSAITGFVAQVSTDGTDYSAGSNTGTSSPIVVTSLTNDTAATVKVWAINAYGTSAPSDASSSFTPAVLQRALFGGGTTGSTVDTIDYIEIATTGNASDFGNLSANRDRLVGLSSATRGLFAGGEEGGSAVNKIEYVTLNTLGNTTDFGDLRFTSGAYFQGACSSATRGLIKGGLTDVDIQYVTIASAGNASDFGDMTVARYSLACCSSTTRGIAAGGQGNMTANKTEIIDYVTIASTGDSTDFGDLSDRRHSLGSASSSTRGTFAGGAYGPSTYSNVIEYITIASTGNGTDFGDLTNSRSYLSGAAGLTRAVFAGGSTGSLVNTIDYITIGTTGNATDFGDMQSARRWYGACSSAHGGL